MRRVYERSPPLAAFNPKGEGDTPFAAFRREHALRPCNDAMIHRPTIRPAVSAVSSGFDDGGKVAAKSSVRSAVRPHRSGGEPPTLHTAVSKIRQKEVKPQNIYAQRLQKSSQHEKCGGAPPQSPANPFSRPDSAAFDSPTDSEPSFPTFRGGKRPYTTQCSCPSVSVCPCSPAPALPTMQKHCRRHERKAPNKRNTSFVLLRAPRGFGSRAPRLRSTSAKKGPQPATAAAHTVRNKLRPAEHTYLRTLTISFFTRPSPTIGACASSGMKIVNCPGLSV